MKKFLAVLLAVSIVLLAGCSGSAGKAPVITLSNSAVAFDELNQYQLILTEINGDYLYSFATNLGNGHGDDAPLAEIYSEFYLLKASFADLSVEKTDITDNMELNNFTSMDVSDDGSVTIYDKNAKKKISFDSSFNYLGCDDCEIEDAEAKAKENTVVDDEYEIYGCGARYSVRNNPGVSYDIMTFNDDNASVSIADVNFETYLSNYNKLIFGCSYINGNDIQLGVFDYENNVCINKTVIECDNSNLYLSVTPVNGTVSDKYAFVNAMFYYGEAQEIENNCYFWEYSNSPENTSFNVEKYSIDKLDEINNDISGEISKNYGIDVHINTAPDEKLVPHTEKTGNIDDIDVPIQLGAKPIRVYNILVQLSDFLGRFPDGFIKEIYSGYYDAKYTGIDIYIVRQIQGDLTSFTNKGDNRLIVTFSTNDFNNALLPHEFMHLIDEKIYDYCKHNNEDYEKEWEALNPEGFKYQSRNTLDERYTPYFATAASLTSQSEERAELFNLLFSDQYQNEKPHWLATYSHIQQKVDFLCSQIRKAYPSLSGAKTQPWEKWITA